jgi:hypothetical protein
VLNLYALVCEPRVTNRPAQAEAFINAIVTRLDDRHYISAYSIALTATNRRNPLPPRILLFWPKQFRLHLSQDCCRFRFFSVILKNPLLKLRALLPGCNRSTIGNFL